MGGGFALYAKAMRFFAPCLLFGALFYALLLAPVLASAHEVYVLSPDTIEASLAADSPNPFSAFLTNRFQFFFWGFLGFLVVTTVFFMSITHRLEALCKPLLVRLKPHAPTVARITLGACLLFSGYEYALFGPELPLSLFGALAPYVQGTLYVSGAMIVLGLYTRAASAAALAIFALGTFFFGTYMLTYANYLGEILLVLLLGGGIWAVARGKTRFRSLEPFAFLILRVLFGLSLVFASIYAKFIHSELALQVVSQYRLTDYFHFDPLFIVLGAGIIEILAGVFIMVGFEVRHTALFLLFWLTLSLLYFQESVWPHLVIFGVLVALFMRGYDRYTVEGRLFGARREPFL